MMVREYQSVIGRETRRQCLERFGGKPDLLLACVGGGSNAIGMFNEFIDDDDVRLIGVEAGGEGINTSKHAATLTMGSPGVLHGSYSYLLQVRPEPGLLASCCAWICSCSHAWTVLRSSYSWDSQNAACTRLSLAACCPSKCCVNAHQNCLSRNCSNALVTAALCAALPVAPPRLTQRVPCLQDEDGQIIDPHSVSAGLDYPGIGPEHAFLKDVLRAEYHSVTDDEALAGFQQLSKLEGIIPALETSHAIAYLDKLCPTLPHGTNVVINCSGRGDKDVNTAIKYLKMD